MTWSTVALRNHRASDYHKTNLNDAEVSSNRRLVMYQHACVACVGVCACKHAHVRAHSLIGLWPLSRGQVWTGACCVTTVSHLVLKLHCRVHLTLDSHSDRRLRFWRTALFHARVTVIRSHLRERLRGKCEGGASAPAPEQKVKKDCFCLDSLSWEPLMEFKVIEEKKSDTATGLLLLGSDSSMEGEKRVITSDCCRFCLSFFCVSNLCWDDRRLQRKERRRVINVWVIHGYRERIIL